VKKSFNIQELLQGKSKCHKTKPMHPSSSRAFQRDQERDLKHPGSVDLISTNKTNKLPSFIDRCVSYTNAGIALAMTSFMVIICHLAKKSFSVHIFDITKID
jgi:hypothetical protein